jgi:hypothetical protein
LIEFKKYILAYSIADNDYCSRYFLNSSVFFFFYLHDVTCLLYPHSMIPGSVRKVVRILFEHKRCIWTNCSFENLMYFHVDRLDIIEFSPLSFGNLPSTIFFSLILIKLSIIIRHFEDCLYLLDGHLK